MAVRRGGGEELNGAYVLWLALACAMAAEAPVATKMSDRVTTIQKLSVHSKYRLSTTKKKIFQGVVSLKTTILLFCAQKLANTLAHKMRAYAHVCG